MTTRNLAKSLHTITALQNVARYLIRDALARGIALNDREAIDMAALMLGVEKQPDVYGLRAKAEQGVRQGYYTKKQYAAEVNATLASQLMANGARQ